VRNYRSHSAQPDSNTRSLGVGSQSYTEAPAKSKYRQHRSASAQPTYNQAQRAQQNVYSQGGPGSGEGERHHGEIGEVGEKPQLPPIGEAPYVVGSEEPLNSYQSAPQQVSAIVFPKELDGRHRKRRDRASRSGSSSRSLDRSRSRRSVSIRSTRSDKGVRSRPKSVVVLSNRNVNRASSSLPLEHVKKYRTQKAHSVMASPLNNYQPAAKLSGSLYGFESLQQKSAAKRLFDPGDYVETKIVYGRNGKSEKWIEAVLVKWNPSDGSWDLKVLNPKKHNVSPVAVHVPQKIIQKSDKSQSVPPGEVPDLLPIQRQRSQTDSQAERRSSPIQRPIKVPERKTKKMKKRKSAPPSSHGHHVYPTAKKSPNSRGRKVKKSPKEGPGRRVVNPYKATKARVDRSRSVFIPSKNSNICAVKRKTINLGHKNRFAAKSLGKSRMPERVKNGSSKKKKSVRFDLKDKTKSPLKLFQIRHPINPEHRIGHEKLVPTCLRSSLNPIPSAPSAQCLIVENYFPQVQTSESLQSLEQTEIDQILFPNRDFSSNSTQADNLIQSDPARIHDEQKNTLTQVRGSLEPVIRCLEGQVFQPGASATYLKDQYSGEIPTDYLNSKYDCKYNYSPVDNFLPPSYEIALKYFCSGDNYYQPPPPDNTPPARPPSPGFDAPGIPQKSFVVKDEDVAQLVGQGFSIQYATNALEMAGGDVNFALAVLLEEKENKKSKRKTKTRQHSFGNWEPEKEVGIWVQGSLPALSVPEANPSGDEFDYHLQFEAPKYGFEILSGKTKKNAIVGERFLPFAKEHLIPGSLLVMVGDLIVLGLPTDEIRQLMIEEMNKSKVVLLRFRNKVEKKKKFQMRGTLRIMVIHGEAMYKSVTHCTIAVGQATLPTDKVKNDKNPVWNNVLTWKPFYPYRLKEPVVIKCWKKGFTGSKIVGRGEFEPPKDTDKLHNFVVDMLSEDGNRVGVIMVKVMVQKYNHARRL